MKININKKLLPMKGHYFLFNAGTAPVVPFMPTYAKQLGFSTVVVGTIYTILPILGMLAKPFFGAIGDRWQKHKLLLILAQIIAAIALFSIMFIPAIENNPKVEFHCHNGENNIKYCLPNNGIDECIKNKLEKHYMKQKIPCTLKCIGNSDLWKIICDHWGVFNNNNNNSTKKTCPYNNKIIDMTTYLSLNHIEDFNSCLYFMLHEIIIDQKSTSHLYCPQNETLFRTNCEMVCHSDYIQELLITTTIDQNKNATESYRFWMFFILMIIGWCGMAVVVSVADAICFELLGDNYHLYGYQRLWGAVGWGILSILSGFLVDKMSNNDNVKDYTIVFYLVLVIIALDVAVSSKLDLKQTKLSTHIFKDVGKLFLIPRVVVFFLWCISVGLCTALVWNYLFIYLEELGKSYNGCDNENYMKTLQGLAMGIQCFGGELPFFFLSKWFFKKIGYIHSMSIVLFAFGIRFLLYSVLKNPWWVLPIEFMNGLTFGIFYSAMASYASIVAPPGTEATLQGLVGAIFEGGGVSFGSFIAGILFKVIGGSKTFLLFGSFSLFACIVHIIVQWLLKKHEKRHGITTQYCAPNDSMIMLEEQEFNYSFMS